MADRIDSQIINVSLNTNILAKFHNDLSWSLKKKLNGTSLVEN